MASIKKQGRVVHLKREPFDVDITRSGVWGNPFIIGVDGTRAKVIQLHRAWFLTNPEMVQRAKRELRGKVLGCWCKPKKCHGDILVEVANANTTFFE